MKNDDDLVFFDKCIFCSSELTSHEKRAKGEHVIPKCLHGSLCMSGVCAKCNSELGRTVDHKAIEDERIISAVLELELPDIETSILDKKRFQTGGPGRGSHASRYVEERKKLASTPSLSVMVFSSAVRAMSPRTFSICSGRDQNSTTMRQRRLLMKR
ncbi:MAG: HNH endonuclease [Candidatus Hydrogenedentales bacterium]